VPIERKQWNLQVEAKLKAAYAAVAEDEGVNDSQVAETALYEWLEKHQKERPPRGWWLPNQKEINLIEALLRLLRAKGEVSKGMAKGVRDNIALWENTIEKKGL
jgi:hypothetical protein